MPTTFNSSIWIRTDLGCAAIGDRTVILASACGIHSMIACRQQQVTIKFSNVTKTLIRAGSL